MGLACDARLVNARSSVLDEIYGARAVGALVAGDWEGALEALEQASWRYLIGFLFRLALLMPSASLLLACRIVGRRFGEPER